LGSQKVKYFFHPWIPVTQKSVKCTCKTHGSTPARRPLVAFFQGCIFFYKPPPPWGGGKESKGLRAREENQRVEKMERQREKKRKISVGLNS
jgi:hypothetical protein